MAKFVLNLKDARQPRSPEAGQQHMSDYRDWLTGLTTRWLCLNWFFVKPVS